MTFLDKHPTPWKLDIIDDEITKTDPWYQRVLDANGNEVIASADQEGHMSWFNGDIHELIDWVNTIGE